MTSMSGNRDHPVAATASSAGGGAERCPRCGSHNTKFCYYNNYNLAQPRHFCKACRRYWTLGGTLRDVPIGGSTRTTPQRSKQPPSSRRRPLPAQAPPPTHASVSSSSASSPPVFNSLDSGSPSIASISIVPYTESTTSNVPGAMDDVGAFTPLLMEPPPAGFMALRGPFHHVFDGFSVDPGLAGSPVGTNGQLCFGMGTGAVSWPSFVDDGAAGVIGGGVAGAVHRDGEEASRVVAGGVELVGGDGSDCFWWPELATSPTSVERGGRQ